MIFDFFLQSMVESIPMVVLLGVAMCLLSRGLREEAMRRLATERLLLELERLTGVAAKPATPPPLEEKPEPLPRAYLVRDGAHVLVGASRPLAGRFRASGEP